MKPSTCYNTLFIMMLQCLCIERRINVLSIYLSIYLSIVVNVIAKALNSERNAPLVFFSTSLSRKWPQQSSGWSRNFQGWTSTTASVATLIELTTLHSRKVVKASAIFV